MLEWFTVSGADVSGGGISPILVEGEQKAPVQPAGGFGWFLIDPCCVRWPAQTGGIAENIL